MSARDLPHGKEPPEIPVWHLRMILIRRAREIIEGRANFERNVRPSTKPLPKIEVDPRDLLRLLESEDR